MQFTSHSGEGMGRTEEERKNVVDVLVAAVIVAAVIVTAVIVSHLNCD